MATSLLDELFGGGGASFGNPNIQRQGAKARALAAQRDVNTLPDPRTYAAVSGLLGTAPDEMGFSVLNPEYESIMQTARPAFVAGTALGVAPFAGKALPAAGRALGPTAAGMAEGYLQRQGLMPSLDVWHGTPHTLPPTARNPLGEFDASRIGTGEGAQVYGHGIYTAEAPAVATEYAKANRGRGAAADNLLDNLSPGIQVDAMRALNMKDGFIRKAMLDDLMASNPKDAKILQSINDQKSGNLYKVDLPDAMIPKMLDWDKHISKQSSEVQKILLPYQKEIGGSFGTGEQTLKAIAFERRMKGLDDSPAAVAEQLRQMGIPGVKYLDQSSRRPGVTSMTQSQIDARIDSLKKDINSGLGDQKRMKEKLSAYEAERNSHANLTRNFVTFPGEEKNMTILERNGLLGTLAP
jgi:hypothetical protein